MEFTLVISSPRNSILVLLFSFNPVSDDENNLSPLTAKNPNKKYLAGVFFDHDAINNANSG
jgi:hypothetical protein